jgi:integrase
MDPAEFERLLKHVRSDHAERLALGSLLWPRQVLWFADVVELAVYTGLRRSELSRLRWRDVSLDADSPTLYVRNTATGKTKSGNERPVPLVPPALQLLQRLQEARTNEDADAPVLLSGDPRRGPKPICGSTTAEWFKEYAQKAKLDDALTLHSTRKTCGTWLLNAGVDMAVVQHILGHSSILTTESVYTAVWDRTIREQINQASCRRPPRWWPRKRR